MHILCGYTDWIKEEQQGNVTAPCTQINRFRQKTYKRLVDIGPSARTFPHARYLSQMQDRTRTLQLIVACMYAAKEKQLGSMLKEAIKEDPLHPVFQYGIFFGSNRRYPSDFGKVRAS